MASGNGKTLETALYVNEISDEYFFLYDIVKAPRIKGQRLEIHDGHKYDILTIEVNGKTTDIYFLTFMSASDILLNWKLYEYQKTDDPVDIKLCVKSRGPQCLWDIEGCERSGVNQNKC